MSYIDDEIAAILRTCEAEHLAPEYKTSDDEKDKKGSAGYPDPIRVSSDDSDVFVVSDLHLATGTGRDGRYDGCENFFFDAEFHRFLNYANMKKRSGNAILIINGDFVDFLRVTYVPGRGPKCGKWETKLRQMKIKKKPDERSMMPLERQDEFDEWRNIIARVGMTETADDLFKSVTNKEVIYGLKTQRSKSVLRLDIVIKGHSQFFDGLAEWLGRGHKLIVIKGNHDLEFYWLEVRNYLRLILAERLASQRAGASVNEVLCETVLPNLTFVDHSLIIDETFYIEHGHRFDPLTRVTGNDTVNQGEELNIPFGSFINRYLLDYLELKYPYLDNIRPTQNILPIMLRRRFFTGLRLLLDHIFVLIKTVPKQYIRFLLGARQIIGLMLLILAALALPFVISFLTPALNSMPSLPFPLSVIVPKFGSATVSYVLVQVLGYFMISEPDSLARNAQELFTGNEYKIITFGHTHNPDQFRKSIGGAIRWFYNTGTWMPIVETTAESLRENKTFMFIHLESDGYGGHKPGVLERWDDDAALPEPMVIIRGVDV
jgi:UDP-2,3-diacylglucosamine pyrophosphatase LpxH